MSFEGFRNVYLNEGCDIELLPVAVRESAIDTRNRFIWINNIYIFNFKFCLDRHEWEFQERFGTYAKNFTSLLFAGI